MTTETTTETDAAIADALYAAGAYCGSCDYEAGPCPDCDACLTSYVKALEGILADVKRHAAADALNRKARSFYNTARMFRDMSRKEGIDHESSTIYWVHANQARTDADALRKEADGIIAEGYEYECQECDTPVPDAGDLCEQHDVDDEDRWAE